MHFLLPQITTAVLLVHLALGCCWHHAHRCVGRGHAAASVGGLADDHAGQVSRSCHGLAAGEHTLPGHDESGEHEHQCEGDRCTFARSERSGEREIRLLSWLDDGLPLSAPLTAALDATHLQYAALADRPRVRAPLPCRAHLLYGVFLI